MRAPQPDNPRETMAEAMDRLHREMLTIAQKVEPERDRAKVVEWVNGYCNANKAKLSAMNYAGTIIALEVTR